MLKERVSSSHSVPRLKVWSYLFCPFLPDAELIHSSNLDASKLSHHTTDVSIFAWWQGLFFPPSLKTALGIRRVEVFEFNFFQSPFAPRRSLWSRDEDAAVLASLLILIDFFFFYMPPFFFFFFRAPSATISCKSSRLRKLIHKSITGQLQQKGVEVL